MTRLLGLKEILKIVNISGRSQQRGIILEGIKKTGSHKVRVTELKDENPDEVNSFDQPFKISPAEREMIIKGNKLDIALAPLSFTIIKQKLQ